MLVKTAWSTGLVVTDYVTGLKKQNAGSRVAWVRV